MLNEEGKERMELERYKRKYGGERDRKIREEDVKKGRTRPKQEASKTTM